jgi:hypothetical protein
VQFFFFFSHSLSLLALCFRWRACSGLPRLWRRPLSWAKPLTSRARRNSVLTRPSPSELCLRRPSTRHRHCRPLCFLFLLPAQEKIVAHPKPGLVGRLGREGRGSRQPLWRHRQQPRQPIVQQMMLGSRRCIVPQRTLFCRPSSLHRVCEFLQPALLRCPLLGQRERGLDCCFQFIRTKTPLYHPSHTAMCASLARRRTLVQMGMSRGTGYYLRSGRGAATTDPEITSKNEPINYFGDRAVLAIGGGWALALGRIASSLFVLRFACAPQVSGPGQRQAPTFARWCAYKSHVAHAAAPVLFYTARPLPCFFAHRIISTPHGHPLLSRVLGG